jgi:TonB family protein
MLGILLLLSAAVQAQTDADAADLIRQVSETAKNLKSLRLEGHIVIDTKTTRSENHDEQVFSIAISRPGLAYFEVGDTLRVCDGETLWTWFAATKRYTQLSHVDPSLCEPVLQAWEGAADNMTSEGIVGRDKVEFEGNSVECEVVRAQYSRAPWFITRGREEPTGIRTLCIDPNRHVILRDTVEATVTRADGSTLQRTTTVTLDKLEVNPELDASLFNFTPAPDAWSQPVPVYRPDPSYDEKARKKKIQGTVILSVVVGADGIPYDIKVVKPLDPGLDKKAVEAVSTWRFKPGMKNGHPAAMKAQVEMNFRLLNN